MRDSAQERMGEVKDGLEDVLGTGSGVWEVLFQINFHITDFTVFS